MALEFLADKQVHGAEGLVVSDDMLLSIALQACLPVLHIGLDAYADWVGIVVYPGDFVIPAASSTRTASSTNTTTRCSAKPGKAARCCCRGSTATTRRPASTWSSTNSPTSSTWATARWTATRAARRHAARRLGRAFQPAYDDFCRRVDDGEDTALDPYGAEHPSEFFAVMSEAFFETPGLLKANTPPFTPSFPATTGKTRPPSNPKRESTNETFLCLSPIAV
jgi:hypothetical protein